MPAPEDDLNKPPPFPIMLSSTASARLKTHRPGTSKINLDFLFFDINERFRIEQLVSKQGDELTIAGIRSPASSDFRVDLLDKLCMTFPRIVSFAQLPQDYIIWIKQHPNKPSHDHDQFVVKDHYVMTEEQADSFKNYILDAIEKKEPVLLHCAAGCGRTGTGLILAKMIFQISTASYEQLLNWKFDKTASTFVEENGMKENGEIEFKLENFTPTTPLIAELAEKERLAMQRLGNDDPTISPDNPIEFKVQLEFLEKMEHKLVQEFMLKKKSTYNAR